MCRTPAKSLRRERTALSDWSGSNTDRTSRTKGLLTKKTAQFPVGPIGPSAIIRQSSPVRSCIAHLSKNSRALLRRPRYESRSR